MYCWLWLVVSRTVRQLYAWGSKTCVSNWSAGFFPTVVSPEVTLCCWKDVKHHSLTFQITKESRERAPAPKTEQMVAKNTGPPRHQFWSTTRFQSCFKIVKITKTVTSVAKRKTGQRQNCVLTWTHRLWLEGFYSNALLCRLGSTPDRGRLKDIFSSSELMLT